MYFNEIVCSDIYSHNGIVLMTGFFCVCFIKVCYTIETVRTVRMHATRCVFQISNKGKMNVVMHFLRALFLLGGSQRCCFLLLFLELSDEGGLELFLVFMF